MESLNTKLKADKGLELAVRIGVHTGLVVAGEMGGGDAIESLAIVGETPNIAARLEGAAKPNSIVISNITANLIQGFFHCESLGPHELKGISEPMELFQVLSESAAQTRFDVAVAAHLTPLVGREQELGLLLDRWEQAKEGLGQVVMLSGEAGIGKSRLSEAFTERLANEPHNLRRLRCSAYHINSALHPFIEYLDGWLGFRRDDTSEEKVAKLERALAEYRIDLNDGVPLLASLLSLPINGRYPRLQISPEDQKQRIREIIVDLLMETKEERPVSLIVDDLHWADPSTLEFLGFFVDKVATAKVLAMFTFRPEFIPPWGSRGHLTQITLNRLPRKLATDMMTQLTGGKEIPEEIVTQIATKSDGVPLFVEELTRMVIESGLVREVDGRYELSGPLTTLAIPSTLQDSLTAKLDRLSSVRETVQLAAVLGREFSYELIRAVSPMDDPTLSQHLGQLVTSEFLYQRGVPPEAKYNFKHALIQDAAYNSLLISRRQQYHRQTARVLGEHFADTMDAQPELLAHHYFEAGLTEEAVTYWLEAGEQALTSYAYQEALTHYQRVLSANENQPPSAEMAAALFGLGRAQESTLGRQQLEVAYQSMNRAFDIYAEIKDVAGAVRVAEFAMLQMVGHRGSGELVARALELTIPDSHEAGRLLSRYVLAKGMGEGDYEGAVEAFNTAMAIAKRTGDLGLEMRTLSHSSRVDFWHLQRQGTVEKGLRAIELALQSEDKLSEVSARFWVGMALLNEGDSAEANKQVEAMLATAENLGGHYVMATALWLSERASSYQGDWQAAKDFNERGLLMSPSDTRLVGTRMLLEYETGNLLEGNRYLDNLVEAPLLGTTASYDHASISLFIPIIARITGMLDQLHVAEAAAETVLSEEFATPLVSRFTGIGLALMAFLRKDVEAAREHYASLSLIGGSIGFITGDRVLGLLAHAIGEWDRAGTHFEDGLAFCRKAGYQPELAWTCCDYADMLLERDGEGDHAKAVSLLEESLAISGKVGMLPLQERVLSRQQKIGAQGS